MKSVKSVLKILIPLALGIGLIIWFWNAMPENDKTETINAFKRANYFWVLLAPLVGFVSNFIRTQRWRLMLRPLGYYPGYWNTFFSVMIMYFFNLFVPRLGEVTRCSILAKYENVPVEKSIGTMVTERLIDVICLGIVVLITLLLMGKANFLAMYDTFKVKTAGMGGGTLMTVLKWSIPFIIVFGILGYSLLFIRKHGVDALKEQMKNKIKSLMISVFSVKDIKEMPQFLLLTVALWVTYLVMFFMNYKALPETSNLPIVSALVCLIFGSMAVVLTPGGIGIFPIIIQTILMSFGVNPNSALAIGMIAWAVQTLGMLIGGMLSLSLLSILNKDAKHETATS